MPESARPLLAVSRLLPAAVERRIAESYNARTNPDDTIFDGEALIAHAEGADGLLVCPTDKLNAELISRLPESVRIIATFSVGYDHVDVKAAAKRGIVVTNTPEVLTNATADLTFLLLLGAARGASWGDRMVREKRWDIWTPTGPLGVEVNGKRLGILGFGRIGRTVAKRARGFDMEIHYHDRARIPPDLEEGAVFHSDLIEFLGHCAFLSINCASTPETQGLINAERIAALPDGAILVNSARGDIVDDDAVIAALQSGKLAAAGLDVFRGEPNIDPRYRDLENAFLLPHLGSATKETRDAMGFRALDNLDAFFAGQTPKDAIRP
ncbi:MAG: D-glycerate dehydrogenase [Hyphomicrobiales bacterium]|nr:D-glycerate dehydrogenase [Hyphomicrobiales bacterium]